MPRLSVLVAAQAGQRRVSDAWRIQMCGERFGGVPLTLVGALLELLVVGRLLDNVEDGDRELSVGERKRLGVGCR